MCCIFVANGGLRSLFVCARSFTNSNLFSPQLKAKWLLDDPTPASRKGLPALLSRPNAIVLVSSVALAGYNAPECHVARASRNGTWMTVATGVFSIETEVRHSLVLFFPRHVPRLLICGILTSVLVEGCTSNTRISSRLLSVSP